MVCPELEMDLMMMVMMVMMMMNMVMMMIIIIIASMMMMMAVWSIVSWVWEILYRICKPYLKP
jgi:uncharacterized protein YggT (Ycf19 family)